MLRLSLFYILVIITAIFYGESVLPRKTKSKKLFIFAHRGASLYAPENTFAAFDKAVEMKADYLELDVQMNSNGELIVIHDMTLDRTTNATGPVKDATNRKLKNIDAGSWFAPSFSGERIPKLKDVLDRYSGKIGLLMELKNPSYYPGIEKRLAKLLKKYSKRQTRKAPFIVQSFDHQSIEKFHNLIPSIRTAVLIGFGSWPNGLEIESFSTYANYLNPFFSSISENLVAMARHHQMEIIAWTVNDPNKANALRELGVFGIVTNQPDLLE